MKNPVLLVVRSTDVPVRTAFRKKYLRFFDFCTYNFANQPEIFFVSLGRKSVNMDGHGMSTLHLVLDECSEGFYPCRDGHCIPTFLLNNGEKYCRYGEDEDIPVHNMTCPGYYRCQGSGSCVHKIYVCDGI